MLRALESQSQLVTTSKGERSAGRGLLWTSALSAVATVAASLPSFLSPYLGRILTIALRPAGEDATGVGGSAATAGKQAADRVLSLLVAGVEPRLLIPAACGAYVGCLAAAETAVAARSVARLLVYVQEVSVEGREGSD